MVKISFRWLFNHFDLRCLANDLAEHQTVMKTLEHRWKELYQQIEQYEHDIDRSIVDEDLNELTQLHENYQVWFNRLSPSTSINDLQVC